MLIKILVQALFLKSVTHALLEQRAFKNSKLHVDGDQGHIVSATNDLSFFVIGDWGGLPDFPFKTLIERQVADSMTKLGEMHNTVFQVALGDNFYFNGVTDVEDKRFKTTYEDVFNSSHLQETPWFLIAGNHDHYGNASAQIEYMKHSKRWIFPNYNYSISVENEKSTLVRMLFIDTILMCGNVEHDSINTVPEFYSRQEKDASDSYFEALENELKAASENVDYLIVAGHFPVWSIAEHGPTQCLVDKLRPLLHKYKVSAYLSGHDHNLQHISDDYLNHRVEYILSGAANFINNSTENINNVPKNSVKYHYGDSVGVVDGGFCLFKVTQENMTVTYIESNGLELYQTTIKPRK